jgi:hypothetical protein
MGRCNHFAREAQPVLEAAAILVGTMIPLTGNRNPNAASASSNGSDHSGTIAPRWIFRFRFRSIASADAKSLFKQPHDLDLPRLSSRPMTLSRAPWDTAPISGKGTQTHLFSFYRERLCTSTRQAHFERDPASWPGSVHSPVAANRVARTHVVIANP